VPRTAGMIPPVAFVFSNTDVRFVIARFVVVAACSEVSPLTVMFDEKSALRVVVDPPKIVSPPACVPSPMVEEACDNREFSVARPLVVSVVTPEIAPLVTSHVSDDMSMRSPPSPMVRVPVVVSVPEIELEPITPPLSVSASLT